MNARTTDPITSHEAAQQHEASGKAESHRRVIYAYILIAPGSTSAEIAAAIGIERHAAARRCPEIEQAGLIVKGPSRKCRVNGTQAVTWLIAPRKGESICEPTNQRKLF